MSTPAETLGLLIKRAQHANHRALEAALAEVDLSLLQWNALREIGRNPGVSMRRLAELTFNSDQGFGALVGRLLRDGLVERRQTAGRALTHSLTREGAARFRKGARIYVRVVERAFSALSDDERESLARLLRKIVAAKPKTGPTAARRRG